MNWNEQAEKIMMERFGHGKDNIIPLATVENGVPHVRYVNAYYEENSFYVITYALSNKMRHMQTNATVAIAGDWFTAHARGESLGWFCDERNRLLAEKMKKEFASRIDNGYNDFRTKTPSFCVWN